ncbi:MAG: 50S ribosomal protein L29 [Oscillospiraceae bacterium]|jgi:large subunit ribosomal protein L29|nr:50S ribosomal protein L29 [Oscillospiraceae bacterium]
MKAKDQRDKFRAMSEQELTKKIADLKEELFNLRFQHATNQLENPLRISQTKKDIAMAKTILREKELKVEA